MGRYFGKSDAELKAEIKNLIGKLRNAAAKIDAIALGKIPSADIHQAIKGKMMEMRYYEDEITAILDELEKRCPGVDMLGRVVSGR